MRFLFFFILLSITIPSGAGVSWAGPYAISAHGDTSSGVNRIGSSIQGFIRGNCSHCHEQHTSVAGSEPDPYSGASSPFGLFADNFSGTAISPYVQADNFCFYCHCSSGALQSEGGISNLSYSNTFGCSGSSDADSILGAFNLLSYHNLKDVALLADSQFSFFDSSSNPCVACHNPHRAKRNREYPDDPAYSAVSTPDDHENLWTQTMNTNYGTLYEPPYCSGTNYEPDGAASDLIGRQNTPDYVAFCGSCHDAITSFYSTSFTRNVLPIDWSLSGDKHGSLSRDTVVTGWDPYDAILPPYDPVSMSSSNVLSCMDCHEPHGSDNIMLLRKRVNAGNLSGNITTTLVNPPDSGYSAYGTGNTEMGYLCMRCHRDDSYAPDPFTSGANEWRYVHHHTHEAPYKGPFSEPCSACHGSGPPDAISCEKCHFHGSDDSWLDDKFPAIKTGRKTF